jgi:NDP-sugar pyrophosphorylase family protein
MTIVISMAGLSSRFKREGYIVPKYMLYIGNKSLFNLSVSSFQNYFKSFSFKFIILDVFDTKTFIERECELLGIDKFEIIILDKPTKGQAETVYMGLKQMQISMESPFFIFNIDTFRDLFILPDDLDKLDGYLEVFEGEGANWSYAKTENVNSTKVVETAEKNEISNFCSTGLYFFKSFGLFEIAYLNYYFLSQIYNSNELYIAPIYNYLIGQGNNIHINLIESQKVTFCGTPSEYLSCLKIFIDKSE